MGAYLNLICGALIWQTCSRHHLFSLIKGNGQGERAGLGTQPVRTDPPCNTVERAPCVRCWLSIKDFKHRMRTALKKNTTNRPPVSPVSKSFSPQGNSRYVNPDFPARTEKGLFLCVMCNTTHRYLLLQAHTHETRNQRLTINRTVLTVACHQMNQNEIPVCCRKVGPMARTAVAILSL